MSSSWISCPESSGGKGLLKGKKSIALKTRKLPMESFSQTIQCTCIFWPHETQAGNLCLLFHEHVHLLSTWFKCFRPRLTKKVHVLFITQSIPVICFAWFQVIIIQSHVPTSLYIHCTLSFTPRSVIGNFMRGVLIFLYNKFATHLTVEVATYSFTIACTLKTKALISTHTKENIWAYIIYFVTLTWAQKAKLTVNFLCFLWWNSVKFGRMVIL